MTNNSPQWSVVGEFMDSFCDESAPSSLAPVSDPPPARCPIDWPASWHSFLLQRFSQILVACPSSISAAIGTHPGTNSHPPRCTNFIPGGQNIVKKVRDFHFRKNKRSLWSTGQVLHSQAASATSIPLEAGLIGIVQQAWRNSGTAEMNRVAMGGLLKAKATLYRNQGDGELDRTLLGFRSKAMPGQEFPLAMDLLLVPKFSEEDCRWRQRREAARALCASGTTTKQPSPSAEPASWSPARTVLTPSTRNIATIGKILIANLQAFPQRTLKGKLIVGVSGDYDAGRRGGQVRTVFEALPPVTPEPPRRGCVRLFRTRHIFHQRGSVKPLNVQSVASRHRSPRERCACRRRRRRNSRRRTSQPALSKSPHPVGTCLLSRWRIRSALRPPRRLPHREEHQKRFHR